MGTCRDKLGAFVALIVVGACGGKQANEQHRSAGSGGGPFAVDGGPSAVVEVAGASAGGAATSLLAPGDEFVPVDDQWIKEGLLSSCQGSSMECEPPTEVFQVVVDISGSMGRLAPGSSVTNWELTRDLLLQLNSSWGSHMGVSFYPNGSTAPNLGSPTAPTGCINPADDVALPAIVNYGSFSSNADIEDALLRVQVNPGGGAATHDAYRMAVDSLLQYQPGGDGVDRRGIVLVTDGHPNYVQGCLGASNSLVDPEPIVAEIAATRAAGIWTIVVGAPGSASEPFTGIDARPWLSRAARAGGRRKLVCSDQGPSFCHLDMTLETDPWAALQSLLLPVCVGCSFGVPLPAEGLSIDQAYFVYRGFDASFLIRQSVEEPCVRGWHYVDEGTGIEVCPETCDLISNLPGGSVILMFSCTP